MRPQAWGYTFAPQGRPKARIAPPLLGAAQRPNWQMRPQAWGYTFAPQGRPKARIASPRLGAAQRPNWQMRPQAWGYTRERRSNWHSYRRVAAALRGKARQRRDDSLRASRAPSRGGLRRQRARRARRGGR